MDNEAQDFCITICKGILGSRVSSGHYIDLDDGQGNPDLWFFSNDGEVLCYPVTKDDIAEVSYPILSI